MNINGLLRNDPGLAENPPVQGIWATVRLQAESHTQRNPERDPMDIARPNEPSEIKSYRKAVRRQSTKEGYTKFLTKLTRIFKDSQTDISDVSKPLEEWLDKKPFRYQSSSVDIWSWAFRVLVPYFIEDPNGWLVPFPYTKDSDEAPATAHDPAERVPIRPLLVPEYDVKSADVDHLVFAYGTETIDKKEYTRYIGIDRTGFYLLRPRKQRDKDGQRERVIYYAETWYQPPSLNENLLAYPLPGYVSRKRMDGRDYWYNESYLHGFFENGDEHMVAFSDSQAVRVRHSYPKMIMKEIPCTSEGCAAGKVKVLDQDGKPIGNRNCSTCKGTGIIQDIGPFDVLFQKDISGGVAQYLVPPSEALRFGVETAEFFLEKAKKSIGLDVLGNEVESGKAKEYRLEDVHDFLATISHGLRETLEAFLGGVEVLLEINQGSRKVPVVVFPTDFKLKDETILLGNFLAAPEAERGPAFLEYVDAKYQDDDTTRAYKAAIQVSWLLLKTSDEKTRLLASGAITLPDFLKSELTPIEALKMAHEGKLPANDDTLVAELTRRVDIAVQKALAGYVTPTES